MKDEFEQYLKRKYNIIKTYFPNLFKTFLPYFNFYKIFKEELGESDYYFLSKLVFAYLGNSISSHNRLVEALDMFHTSIKSTDCGYYGSYYKFKDGNLYDIDDKFVRGLFISKIDSAGKEFNALLYETCAKLNFNYESLRDKMIYQTKKLINDIDSDDENLTSFEYAELAFIQHLNVELEEFNLEKIFNSTL